MAVFLAGYSRILGKIRGADTDRLRSKGLNKAMVYIPITTLYVEFD